LELTLRASWAYWAEVLVLMTDGITVLQKK